MRSAAFLFLLLALSLSSAAELSFEKTDYLVHIRDVCNPSVCCSYYGISNPGLASISDMRFSAGNWSLLKGQVLSEKWELLVESQEEYQVFIEDGGCSYDERGIVLNCSGHSETRNKTVQAWNEISGKNILMLPGKAHTVRVCGDIKTVYQEGKGWSVEVDHWPRLKSDSSKLDFIYPEYAWWNTTWANRTNLTMPTLRKDYDTVNFTLTNPAALECSNMSGYSDMRIVQQNDTYEESLSFYILSYTDSLITGRFLARNNIADSEVWVYCGDDPANSSANVQNCSEVDLFCDDADSNASSFNLYTQDTLAAYEYSGGHLYLQPGNKWYTTATFGENVTFIFRRNISGVDIFYWGPRSEPWADEAGFSFQHDDGGVKREHRNAKATATNSIVGTGSTDWEEERIVWFGSANVTHLYAGNSHVNTGQVPIVSTLRFFYWTDGTSSSGIDYLHVINVTSEILATQGDSEGYSVNNITIASSTAAPFETENSTVNITITGANGTIEEYNITVYYNGTLIYSENTSGVNTPAVTFNLTAVAPLVPANETAVAIEVYVNGTVAGSYTSVHESFTQTVLEWYYAEAFTVTRASDYTVEETNTITIGTPSVPSDAPENASYDGFAYYFDYCSEINSTGYSQNVSCNSTLSTGLYSLSVGASHSNNPGIIFVDSFVNRTWNLSFNGTGGTSYKTISDSQNVSREYILWLVNSTNQSINGAGNISDLFIISFFDEVNLTALSVDSAANTYSIAFTDGYIKNFSLNDGNTTSTTIRAYPDFATVTLSSSEVYSKVDYTTRSRFILSSSTDFDTAQNISVYLLPDSEATYVIINVVDAGDPVDGAYVQILKYYSTTGSYLNIEQKITNVNGQASANVDLDSFYRFAVYNSAGSQQYYSSDMEQFICNSGTCSVTIDISGASAIDYQYSYESAVCYGLNATSQIYFDYLDQTGKTSQLNFLVYRLYNDTDVIPDPVCNYTVSGSSASYTCPLSAPENITKYAYACVIFRSASPPKLVYGDVIDFRDPSLGMQDWMFIMIIAVIGVAGAATGPAVGIAAVGLMVGLMYYLNVLNMNVGAMAGIVVTALAVAFLMQRGNN